MAIDLAALARKQYEIFNAHDANKLAEIATDDCTMTIVPFGQVLKGRNGYVEFGKMWFSAFPDVNVRVKNLFTVGEWVVTEYEATGTHKGTLRSPMGDIPATGKHGVVPGVELMRFREGKIIESRMYIDALALMRNLGLLPEKLIPTRPVSAQPEISPQL